MTIIATGFDYNQMNMVSYSPLQGYKDSLRKSVPTEEPGMQAEQGEPSVEPEAREPEGPFKTRIHKPVAPAAQPSAPEAPRPFERPAPRPAASQAQNPFAAPVAQQTIASKRDKESDIDIDELENRPAFVRRNVKFVKDNSAEGGRSSRVALKDDSAPSDKTQNSSLFD